MSKENRKFIFNLEWMDKLDGFPEEVKTEVLYGIIRYAATGELDGLKPLAKMAMSFIRGEMDFNKRSWEEAARIRSEAGRKGMKARWTKGDNSDNSVITGDNSDNSVITGDNSDNSVISVNNKNNIYELCTMYDIKETPNGVKKSAPRFSPPTVEEVSSYIAEKGYAFTAEAFFDFYESKGWMVGRNKMRDWKAAVRNWQRGESERRIHATDEESRKAGRAARAAESVARLGAESGLDREDLW